MGGGGGHTKEGVQHYTPYTPLQCKSLSLQGTIFMELPEFLDSLLRTKKLNPRYTPTPPHPTFHPDQRNWLQVGASRHKTAVNGEGEVGAAEVV